MTIDNNCGREDGMHDYPGSQAEAHSQIALEQSALVAAKLAIARWTNANRAAPAAPAAPARADWYAAAQRNFQEWLGKGGFAQYEITASELAEPLPSAALSAASAGMPAAGSVAAPAPTCIG